MKANIIELILQELNISKFAIQVYLDCMETSEPNITKIAKKMKVERSRVYSAIEELTENGLIAAKESYSRSILLNSPSKLIAKLRDQEIRSRRLMEDFTKFLPDLNAQYYSHKNQPIFKIYEGKTQFIDLFNDVLNDVDKEEGLRFFGNVDDFFDLVGFDYHLEWTYQRIKKQIPSKVLYFSSSRMNKVALKNNEQFRQSKILPDTHKVSGSYYLYANKSIHWNPVFPKAILIEDSVINSTFRSNFELLWEACGGN
jgi:sugar-specific transcriptional regulator TrmB